MVNSGKNPQKLDLSRIKNLAITGVNGFVGKSIVDFLASLNKNQLPQALTLITRSGIKFELHPNLKAISDEIEQDLSHSWNIPTDISHLINLAADGSTNSYSEEACSRYEMISNNLVSWIKKSQSEKRILHSSSGACFGYKALNRDQKNDPTKEIFIKSRISVENHLIEASSSHGFEIAIARLFTFSGKNILSKSQYAISNFINSAVKLGQLDIIGDPLTQRSYLHQDDMSAWLLSALVTTDAYSDLQIGSDKSVTIGELADFIGESTGAKVNYAPNPRSGDIYIPQTDDTRIKLRAEESIGWQDAVKEMIAEARNS